MKVVMSIHQRLKHHYASTAKIELSGVSGILPEPSISKGNQMANNRFTGEHSTLLINFDHVVYATSDGPQGGQLKVVMSNGKILILTHGNADMFRNQWREYPNSKSERP